jgi:hypothetical protein
MPELPDLDAIEAEHVQLLCTCCCDECGDAWPCDAVQLVALARAQAAELAAARDAVAFVLRRAHLVDQGYAGDGWQTDELAYQEKILWSFLAGTLQVAPLDDDDA